jgi:hypothetical protein
MLLPRFRNSRSLPERENLTKEAIFYPGYGTPTSLLVYKTFFFRTLLKLLQQPLSDQAEHFVAGLGQTVIGAGE